MGCENDARWRVDDGERRLIRGLTYLDVHGILTGDQRADESDQISALRVRLAEVERRRDLLLAAVETGDDKAVARFAELAKEVKAVRKELAAAEEEAAKAAADPGMKARLAELIDLSRLMDRSGGMSGPQFGHVFPNRSAGWSGRCASIRSWVLSPS
jgi:hypothetical protein